MRIAIVDDEIIYINKISEHVMNEFKSETVILNKYQSAEEMLTKCKYLDLDILITDIEMLAIDGFKLVSMFKKIYANLEVVFITSHDEMVYSSFEHRPFAFVRKTKIDEELPEVLDSLHLEIINKNAEIMFDTSQGLRKLSINEILYIEVYGHELICHTLNDKFTIKGTLDKLEKILEDSGFVRCHRSHLVNIKKIFTINRIDVVLTNKECIPLSKYRIEDVKRKFIASLR